MADDIDEQIAFLDKLDDEGVRIARNCINMRLQNSKIVDDIEKFGGEVDVQVARLEHLLTSLVEYGILDAKAMWQIQLDWEKTLRVQLKPVREKLEALSKTPRPKAQKQLWLPDQKG